MHFKSLFFSSLILLYSGLAYSQSYSEKKIIRKSLAAGKEVKLELDNKYGSINITAWNKDSISVRAEIEAYASSLDRLHKMFEGVDVNVSETTYLVRVQTEFKENLSMIFESFKGMTNKLIPYESKLQINYFINAPEYLNMKIVNKYGDVYMEKSTGKFSIDISNGAFKANSLGATDGINLNFCDATINSLESGYIDASFSDIVIGNSKDITVNSISSHFDIRKAGRISTESRRDKFFIGTVSSISGNSYFTDFKIDDLQKDLNLSTKYGNLNADLVEKGFEMITVNSGYTDINLEFEPPAAYNLDIRHSNTFLVIPDKNISVEKKTLDEEKKEFMTYGTVGKNPGNRKVMIEANRGNIYLK